MSAPTVSVSATVQREAEPDSFTISASVTGEGPDAAAAADSLATRYATLEDAVSRLPGSVEVRRAPVNTWHEGRRQQTWHAERSMSLRGGDVAVAGEVMTALAPLADVTLNGPAWHVGLDNPVHGDLQADAVRAVRLRAERYAVALGGTLGQLIELRDPGTRPGGPVRAVALASAGGGDEFAELDFDPQALTVSASVHATWALVLPER